MSKAHTQTYWHKSESTWDDSHFLSGKTPTIRAENADIIFCSLGASPADTEALRDLTFRAVNSHAAMKEALEWALGELDLVSGVGYSQRLSGQQMILVEKMTIARAALKLAQEGE